MVLQRGLGDCVDLHAKGGNGDRECDRLKWYVHIDASPPLASRVDDFGTQNVNAVSVKLDLDILWNSV